MGEHITYGFWADLANLPAQSHVYQQLHADDLAAYWRRSSLSADFWSRYVALFVDIPAPAGYLRRSDIEQAVSFLLNELFENCAKFSNAPIRSVTYNAWVDAERIVFQLTNHVIPERAESFRQFVEELLGSDPVEAYFKRLEEQAETNAKGSGLGYLSLINDYGVRFGFRFRPITATSVAVDVQAHLSRQEQSHGG
jgi:hypothetical protein